MKVKLKVMHGDHLHPMLCYVIVLVSLLLKWYTIRFIQIASKLYI